MMELVTGSRFEAVAERVAGLLLLSCQASWVCGACKDWVGAAAPVSRLPVRSAPGTLSTVPCGRHLLQALGAWKGEEPQIRPFDSLGRGRKNWQECLKFDR